MKKDGTIYLVQYILNDVVKYDIVHWASAAMISPQFDCWCNQSGMGLKIDEIVKFIKLTDVLELMQLN